MQILKSRPKRSPFESFRANHSAFRSPFEPFCANYHSVFRSHRSVQTVQRSVDCSSRSVQTVQRSTGVVVHFRVCKMTSLCRSQCKMMSLCAVSSWELEKQTWDGHIYVVCCYSVCSQLFCRTCSDFLNVIFQFATFLTHSKFYC
jgi:hypothetical protein